MERLGALMLSIAASARVSPLAGIEVPSAAAGSPSKTPWSSTRALYLRANSIPLLADSDSSPSVMAEHVPAIRSGTSLRQMAHWVAGSEEWVAITQ